MLAPDYIGHHGRCSSKLLRDQIVSATSGIGRRVRHGILIFAIGGALAAVAAAIFGLATACGACSLPESTIEAPAIKLRADRGFIGVIHPAHRAQIWARLESVPPIAIVAVLVAEDRRFWTHPGVDPVAMARAISANVRHREVREGASTITQQLARTLFLDGARTWRRKALESMIAVWLEARYSKARILEAYLNSVYLGHDGDIAVYGLPAA